VRWSQRVFALLVVVLFVVPFDVLPASSAPSWWVPPQGLRWQYQLQGNVNVGLCVVPVSGGSCVRPQAYDIDLYANDGVTLNSAAVAAIHEAHAYAVCYVDAGTFENWRPDAAEYPKSVKGRSNGWPGEVWLDIRATSILLPIIDARVAKCATAGFDAVEFDNVEGYANNTGFLLTADDQLTFNLALANMAHSYDLGVALKNDIGQLAALQSSFDFAINEQCAQYKECDGYNGWTSAGKAVVEVEYTGRPKIYCVAADTGRRDAFHKSLALLAKPWKPCR
jgi:hypothetical protein